MNTEPEIDGNASVLPTDDLTDDQKKSTDREIRSFPWFGGMKTIHYYVMKDK